MDARDCFDAIAGILEEPYRNFLGELFRLCDSLVCKRNRDAISEGGSRFHDRLRMKPAYR